MLALPGYGQDASDSLDVGLVEGSWSLQFQIYQPSTFVRGISSFASGSSILNEFDGGVVSAKFHLSDRTAIRGSVGFNRTDDVTDLSSRFEDIDALTGDVDRGGSDEVNEMDFWVSNVSLLYLRYIEPAPSFAFYLGIGPGFELTLNDNSRDLEHRSFPNESFSSNFRAIIIDLWGTGLHTVLGAEWFVAPGISLLAEYHSELFYKEFEITRQFEVTNENSYRWTEIVEKRKGFFFDSLPARLGLSVYF